MTDPAQRWLTPDRMVRVAIGVGVIGIIAVAVFTVRAFSRGDRPEEEVAAAYLDGLLEGDLEGAYELTSRAYQRLVFPADHALLAGALRDVVGADPTVRILGSERTIGSEPLESLVGYSGSTAVGRIEGVVTLYLVDDVWSVGAVWFDFPEAAPDQTADFYATVERLNAQFVVRTGTMRPSPAPS